MKESDLFVYNFQNLINKEKTGKSLIIISQLLPQLAIMDDSGGGFVTLATRDKGDARSSIFKTMDTLQAGRL